MAMILHNKCTLIKQKKRYPKKILVIEDDPTMGKGIQIILRSELYDVMVKDNSSDAISFIKEDKPDLIITDLFLDNINGLEIYKKFNKKIPTMIITGSVDTKLAQKAKKTAGSSFLEKPFSPEMLTSKVNELSLKNKNK